MQCYVRPVALGKSLRQSAVEPSLSDDRVGAMLESGADVAADAIESAPLHDPARLGAGHDAAALAIVAAGRNAESVRCGPLCARGGNVGMRRSRSKAKGAGGEGGATAFSRHTSIRRSNGVADDPASDRPRAQPQHPSYRQSTHPARTSTDTTPRTIETTGIDELDDDVSADALQRQASSAVAGMRTLDWAPRR